MPNWCENNLDVYGKKKLLEKFIRENKDEDTDLSLQKLRPIDGEIDCGTASDLWGTKWDVEAGLDGDPEDEWIRYGFDSAWAPPIEAIVDGSRKYPKLEFTLHYREPGMAFAGVLLAKNGKIIKRQELEWNWPSDS